MSDSEVVPEKEKHPYSVNLINNIEIACQARGKDRKIVMKELSIGSTYGNWKSLGNLPNLKHLISLSEYFDVSLDWLLKGQGEPDHNSTITIPQYDVSFSAGSGSITDRAQKLDDIPLSQQYCQTFLPYKNYKELCGFMVRGDSMEPTIADRSIIMVDQGDNQLKHDAIMAILLNDECYIKRIHTLLHGFEIRSDNDFYDTITVPPEDIDQVQVIGRVIANLKTI